MATFELFTETESKKEKLSKQADLGSTVLLSNARWFTRVRWIVIALFIVIGLTGNLLPGMLESLGILPPVYWPWVLAGVLILTNIAFSFHVNRLTEDSGKSVEINIWLQIITDLLVITVLVYIVGSTTTFIPFIYIFHIAMACIFFRPLGSLIVTLMASGLYILEVVFEITGILPTRSIIIDIMTRLQEEPLIALFNAFSAIFIWLVTWYLVSTLSRVVRRQDEKLNEANRKLLEANEEKTMQVLVTTHELKSPVSGIEALINLLRYKYWDEIPNSVKEIIERIEARSKTLRERIKEILTLGNIKMGNIDNTAVEPVGIEDIISSVLKSLKEEAEKRKITIKKDIEGKIIYGNKEHLSILFSNLIMNAIVYSHEGGTVEISAKIKKNELHVYITDHGIGIREDAMPHIFDEYYRTNEGAKFNERSTGLGLSIVREIAKSYGYGIKVESQVNKGTTFEIIISDNKKSIEKRDEL